MYLPVVANQMDPYALAEPAASPKPVHGPVEAAAPSSMGAVMVETAETMETKSPEIHAQDLNRESKAPEAEHHDSPYVFPSGIPGMGNSILGPRVPGSSTTSSRYDPKKVILSPIMEDMNPRGISNEVQSRPISSAAKVAHSSTVVSGTKRKVTMPEFEEDGAETKRHSRDTNADPSDPLPFISEQRPMANNDAEDEYEGEDAEDGSETEEAELARLIFNFKDIMQPYTLLHPTCAATEPAQKIVAALSSRTLTRMVIMALIHDALEALRSLRDRQVVDIMGAEPTLQRAGLDSCLNEARDKVQQTGIDVLNLEKWLEECNEDPNT